MSSTDRRTDGRTRWIQYTPPPTSLGGGIMMWWFQAALWRLWCARLPGWVESEWLSPHGRCHSWFSGTWLPVWWDASGIQSCPGYVHDLLPAGTTPTWLIYKSSLRTRGHSTTSHTWSGHKDTQLHQIYDNSRHNAIGFQLDQNLSNFQLKYLHNEYFFYYLV